MQHPHSWTFKRTESDGIYFTDLMASLNNSVKFDVFDDSKQIATLVTNNKKAFALTSDDLKLSMKSRSNWLTKWYYYLTDESGNSVATILVQKPFIGKAVFKITFEKTNSTYQLRRRKYRESKKSNANFVYDLLRNNEAVCTIINYKKPPFICLPTKVHLEGVIIFDDGLGIDEAICFLPLINIHIDNED